MMYMNLNDANIREQIIFGRDYNPETYRYRGMVRFDRLDKEDARKLMELGFLDPDDCQNDSPTAKEFLEFAENHGEGWILHGYVISPERDDCRVTIEGLCCEMELTKEELVDFVQLCRFADNFDIENGAYCWYD